MKAVLSCFTFLALLLTIGCSSAMRSSTNNNGRSSVVISSVSLNSVSSGAQDFTLTIVGSGFPASPSTTKDHPSVFWGVGSQNGVYLDIDFAQCDATHIIATVPADLVQNGGTFDIQVQIFYFADDTPKAVSNIVHLVVDSGSGSGSGSWDY